ncbi:stalk domain-containing protein [Paenibacillus beijingensis]|uniref:stalk domain-containing protein n=1 Tax=Paenibacillus beijingensis TaxID=1126833 RepID=UPI0006972E04|nr:hypothetical protein [Paenibacillus beijingensis]
MKTIRISIVAAFVLMCLPLLQTSVFAADAKSPVMVGIAAGYGHAIGLWSDGSVAGWGFNKSGQVGDGTKIDQYVPKKLPGLPPIIQVAASGGQSFALDRDGKVWAWGLTYTTSNFEATGQYYTTTLPHRLDGITDAVSIHSGGSLGAAILKSGQIDLWYPFYDPNTNESSHRYLSLEGMGPAKSAAISGSDVFVLKQDGTVRMVNVYNEFAGRFRLESELRIKQILPMTDIKAIAAAGNDVFMLQGNGTAMRYNTLTKKLANVHGLDRIYDIKTASNQLIALKNNGTVWLWKYNELPLKSPVKIEGLSHIASIAGSSSQLHFAIQKNGTAFAWGSGYYGSMGTGTGDNADDFNTPKKIAQPLTWVINGEEISFSASSSIHEGKLYVPYNSVWEPLGISVTLGQTKPDNNYRIFSIWTLAYRGKTIVFKDGDPAVMYVNGKQSGIHAELRHLSNSTQFPLELICGQFGIRYKWEPSTGIVTLESMKQN